jgi:lipopolysaccharide transport system ATP-binding protein
VSAFAGRASGSLVAVSCRGVSKRYALMDTGNAWRFALGLATPSRYYQALSDVSFDVPKGRFTGILGRNGAGKSTLLRVLGGIYAPDSGSVQIDGELSAIYELGTAGNAQLSGRGYAERLLAVQGFSGREKRLLLSDIHEFSELGERFDDPVYTYSAGMGARLYFATATAGHHDVYLLDEVLSVGDAHFQAKCWRRMRERLAHGASGVFVTHDWSAILKICETACILENGRIAFEGPSAQAIRRYLYGEEARQTYRQGLASIVSPRPAQVLVRQGEDLVIDVDIRIDAAEEVFLLAVIERLQPGFGWETALMSRRATPMGAGPALRTARVAFERLPLEPGSYQVALQVVARDPEHSGRYSVLDAWAWLDGTGLPLLVEAPGTWGMKLPGKWRIDGAGGVQ